MTQRLEPAMGAMVEASPDGMLLVAGDGTIRFANARVETLFGIDRDALVGNPVEELLPVRHRDGHVDRRSAYHQRPRSRSMGSGLDLIARRADGTEFPVEVSLSPLTIGEDDLVVATVRDISERIALETNAAAVMRTIDATHDGVFVFAPECSSFDYVNRGAAEQLGYDEATLLSRSPLDIMCDYTEQSLRALVRPLIDDSLSSLVFTTVLRRADGDDLAVEIRLEYPPAVGPDRPRLLVAVARDIAERLRAEHELRRRQSQLQVLEDRERLAQDLHDVVIQRIFAAGMGLQAVRSRIADPAVAERVDRTVTELDETISELRSRIFYLNQTPEDGAVASRLRETVAQAAVSLGHEPSLEVVGDAEAIPGDVLAQMLPVLTEALSNVARHARADATHVLVRVNNEIELTVTDDGVGIAVNATHGRGLPNLLARAQRIGGTTSISGKPGGGTTLRWTVPRR